MYKLLIAEDEEIERYALTRILKQQYGELLEISSVCDGEEAVDMALEKEPDIVLMDIKMPGKDGIEASKLIFKALVDTRIIILTAYDSFDYAQKSINIGIKDYLLKPIKSDCLFDAINKQIMDIEKQKAALKDLVAARQSVEKLKPMLKNLILGKIVSDDIDSEEIHEYLEILGLSIETACIVVIELVLDSSEVRYVNRAIISNAVMELVKSDSRFNHLLLSNYGNSRYITGLFHNTLDEINSDELENRINIINYCEDLYKAIYQSLFVKVRIGISESASNLSNFYTFYRQALFALNHGENTINHYSDIVSKDIEVVYPKKIERDILENIFKKEASELLTSFEEFTAQLTCGKSMPISLIKNAVIQLVMAVIKNVSDKLVIPYQLSNGLLLSELAKSDTINDIKSFGWEVLKEINADVIASFRNKNNSVIEDIKNYIDRNCAKDITLDDISKHVNISPSHLSRLFKKETNYNLFDYISFVRIEKSKELLVCSNSSVKEISIDVGFSDPNYYCKVFKRVTGITPSAYRDMNSATT